MDSKTADMTAGIAGCVGALVVLGGQSSRVEVGGHVRMAHTDMVGTVISFDETTSSAEVVMHPESIEANDGSMATKKNKAAKRVTAGALSFISHALIHISHSHSYLTLSFISHTLIHISRSNSHLTLSFISHTLIHISHSLSYPTLSFISHTLIHIANSHSYLTLSFISHTLYHIPPSHSYLAL